MAQFDIYHKDILKVIRLKEIEGNLERLNISIRIPDQFYKDLKENPDKLHIEGFTTQDIWNEIIDKAWKSGDPGIFNSDIAYRQCTTTNLSDIVASNPCAEYVNIPYSSCNLGSINLTKFVTRDKQFDWGDFEQTVKLATRFLDSVIDVNDYPLDKIKEVTQMIRPIGLGVFGLGHLLYLLEIPYNSEEGLELIDDIIYGLTIESIYESTYLAKEKGSSYPTFDKDLFFKANERIFKKLTFDDLKAQIKIYGIRNSCFTSIAPTGTISYLAGQLSGGIEPVYALAYSRRIEKENKEYETVYITDSIFEQWLDKYISDPKLLCYDNLLSNKDIKQIILDKICKNNGSCQGIDEIPEYYQKVFVTAHDLTPNEHLDVLGIVAKNTSLSVSKTINLPKTATRKDISNIYIRAHELGIIGVTVYRDGCRSQILNSSSEVKVKEITSSHAPKRPKSLDAHFYPITVKGNKFGVIVGLLEGKPYEIFCMPEPLRLKECTGVIIKFAKGQYNFVSDNTEIRNIHISSELERSITILTSQLLRHGVELKYIINTIDKVGNSIVDFSSAIRRVLSKYLDKEVIKDVCPDCGGIVVRSGGCSTCQDCGKSRCE